MKFSDLWKKGFGIPGPSDLVDGGIGIDIQGKKAYSKGSDGTIFPLGLNESETTELVDASLALPPIGSVIMFAGNINNLPINWAICNGSNQTPDLRNKFVYGTDVSYNNSTGGYADSVNVLHNHTQPGHNHTASFSGNALAPHTHNFDVHSTTGNITNHSPRASGGQKVGIWTTKSVSAGIPSGTVTVDSKIALVNSSGVSGAGRNIPPYVKLVYIMRLS